MFLFKKPVPSLYCLAAAQLLIGASQLQAQDAGTQVLIKVANESANSADSLQQKVSVTVQAFNFTGSDIKADNHKAHGFWKTVGDAMAKRGNAQIQSDTSRQSATAHLTFAAWKEGEPFLKTGVAVPPAWSNVAGGVRQVELEVEDFAETWDTLDAADRNDIKNKFAFIRFHDKVGGHDARTAWICASLPYAVEKGTLKFPVALQPLVNELCQSAEPRLFQMTFSANDWGTPDELPPKDPTLPASAPLDVRVLSVLTTPRFAGEFIALRRPFERICGIDALSDRVIKNSLIEAGWIDRKLVPAPGVDININDAMDSCNETIINKLIPGTAEALKHFAMKGSFVPNNKWLNTRLRGLAEARKDEWLSGETVAQELASELAKELTLDKGYTNTPFVLGRDLNVAKAMEAAGGFPALQGASLVAKLFAVETDGQKTSPLLKELKNLKLSYPDVGEPELRKMRAKYDERLVKLVTQACLEGEVEVNCLAESLGLAESWENTPQVVLTHNDRVVAKKYGLIVGN